MALATRAAVSPRLAAEIYGLDILLKDIEDEHNNTTRFLVMSRDAVTPEPGVDCVTSFVFRVRSAASRPTA